MDCVFCPLPIGSGEIAIGAGDGSGQRFAHEACWWRKRAQDLEARLQASIQPKPAHLTVLLSREATAFFEDEGSNWQYCKERATFSHHDACEFIIDCGTTDHVESRVNEMCRYGCTPDFIDAYRSSATAGASHVLFWA